MVDVGLRDAGYHYVVLDDCWSQGRGENGSLVANTTRFPRGIRHVSDRIHELGMGFGMYSSAGSLTCARYEGSLGSEDVDAQTFADWGVDYLKYDNCYNEGQEGTPMLSYNRYKRMSDALNATGRPILYSMCNWGDDRPWDWAQTLANSWRMSGDITDSFNRVDPRCPCSGDEGYLCAFPGFHCSAMNILNKVCPLNSSLMASGQIDVHSSSLFLFAAASLTRNRTASMPCDSTKPSIAPPASTVPACVPSSTGSPFATPSP